MTLDMFFFPSLTLTPFVIDWVLIGSEALASILPCLECGHAADSSPDIGHTLQWPCFLLPLHSCSHIVSVWPLWDFLPGQTSAPFCGPCVGASYPACLCLFLTDFVCSYIYCICIIWQVVFITVNPKSLSFLVRPLGFLPKFMWTYDLPTLLPPPDTSDLPPAGFNGLPTPHFYLFSCLLVIITVL